VSYPINPKGESIRRMLREMRTYKEIALTLRVPLSTVKWQVDQQKMLRIPLGPTIAPGTTATVPLGGIPYTHTVNRPVTGRLTETKLYEKLPEDIRNVMQDAKTKGQWLVGDYQVAWQDTMIIGLCAILAENSHLFVKKPTTSNDRNQTD